MTTYRNASVQTLQTLSAALLEGGFKVDPVVVPETQWVGGNPYVNTDATSNDVMRVMRDLRGCGEV